MSEFGAYSNAPKNKPLGERRAPFFTQQRLIIGLSIIAALGVFFGGSRLLDGIRSPFVNEELVSVDLAEQTALTDKLVDLATRDTDSDGINDFQELYQFGTSPYLRDSDSDGLDDLAELESGTNPNCPEGQDCEGFLPREVTEQAPTIPEEGGTEVGTAPDPSENITVSALRETLKNSGAPQYILDATSDEELLQIYTDVAGEGVPATESTDGTGASDATDTTANLESLRTFTPGDIRELLISTGVDGTLLAEISDEDLKEIFDQALEAELSGNDQVQLISPTP